MAAAGGWLNHVVHVPRQNSESYKFHVASYGTALRLV
jgi:hypothetical protein